MAEAIHPGMGVFFPNTLSVIDGATHSCKGRIVCDLENVGEMYRVNELALYSR
jgi:hypothetical protein